MTLAAADIPFEGSEHLVLDDVPWEVYEDLLDAIGDRAIRVTYFEGRLEIMSPPFKHERWKSIIGRLIEMLSLELDMPLVPAGSTTFRRKDKRAGLEPDECYYIQHAAQMIGKEELTLPTDPPPDLAVEVDNTRRSIARQPVYAALGVRELWRYDGKQLHFLELTSDGRYVPISKSLAFPFLLPADLQHYVELLKAGSDVKTLRAFQQWARTLKP